MATDVPTNSSPTPRRSGNIAKTTPNTELRTSGIKPQNTFDPRPTADEAVDQILVGAKPPLGEGEVIEVVERLENVSEKHLLPRVDVSNQRTTDAAATPPNGSA